MRLPENPPALAALPTELDPVRVAALLGQIDPQPLGRYLHWDELRRRPAPAGLSHEDWWTAVSIARRPLLQRLPLLDKQGQPFKVYRVAKLRKFGARVLAAEAVMENLQSGSSTKVEILKLDETPLPEEAFSERGLERG